MLYMNLPHMEKSFMLSLRDQLHAAGYGLQFNYRPSEEVENTEE